MKQLIKAEYLKQKKTLTTKIPFIAPLIVLAMSYILTGGMFKAFAPGAWNWWYTLFLPGTLAIICNQIVSKDKKRKYHNIFTLSIAPEKIWIAKMIVCASYLFLANVIVCIGAISGGFLFGTYITVSANIIAAFVFSAGHLPATQMFFGRITGLILIRCFLLNGVFALFFGRWFRKYGIQYAMLGHFGIHLISKIILICVI